MRRSPFVAIACALVLVACGSSDEGGSTDTGSGDIDSTVTQPPVVDDPTTTIDDGNATTDEPSFPATLGDPADGWTEPVDVASRFAPGVEPTDYLVERIGVVSVLDADGSRGATALDMTDLTVADGERGLLGLAFDFDGNRAFVNYTDLDGNTNVDQYRVLEDGTFDAATRERVWFLPQPYPNHNGGEILWADGALWIFTGDGGSGGDPDRVALDPESRLGKVVKLVETDGRWSDGEIVAVGLRNPWRAFLDQETDEFWIADVGQNEIEEINVVGRGDIDGVSFGWSHLESTSVFNQDQSERHASYRSVEPVLDYRHTDGRCSISGGAVYRGERVPSVGTWFVYADWCTGEVFATCFDESRAQCGTVTLGTVSRAVGVVADAAGELWVLSQDGPVVPIVGA